MIEIKIGDDLIFVEKKYIKLGSAALEKPEELKVQRLEEDDDDDDDDDDDEKFSLDTMTDDIVDDIVDNIIGDDDDEHHEDDDDDDEHHEDDDEHHEDDDDDDEAQSKGEFEVPAELEEIPVKEPGSDLEVLRAKLKKSLEELEDIRSDMSASFTSTSTISTTIQSLKGMLDALKKDQMNILSREQ